MNKIQLNATIPAELAGERLDSALATLFPAYSRSRIKTWITEQAVLINGHSAKPRDKVSTSDTVQILATVPLQNNWQSANIPLDIIYEDSDLLVINKPAGLVVHPGAGNPENTLLNAILHHYPEAQHLPRGGIVHRIDKDTTGLLVIAKTIEAHTALVQQLQDHEIEREYLAVCQGLIISGGTVNEAIARHPTKRTHMAISASGKKAVTHYRLVEKFKGHTFIRVNLETGRTHQIRVHMAHLKHPLVGDQTYGGRTMLQKNVSAELKLALAQFKRQALHAHSLTLTHPRTGEEHTWTCELPEDFKQLLATLKKDKERT